MSYKGRYSVKNIKKYKGDFNNVIYRSLWERSFMKYCDFNENILQWSSEEIVIPYKSPLDGKMHRYFTDFWIKALGKDGSIKQIIIEIKPHKETIEPSVPKRKTKKYIIEVAKYCKNTAKWDAARLYCKKYNMEFKILTEYDLNIKKRKN